MPKQPGTITVSTRVDPRDLHWLALFYQSQGRFPRTRSAVITMSLRYLTSILSQDSKIERATTTEALAWLKQYLGLQTNLPEFRPSGDLPQPEAEQERVDQIVKETLDRMQADVARRKQERYQCICMPETPTTSSRYRP